MSVRTSIHFRNVNDSDVTPLSLDATAAQQLMNDLFACGIRPSEGSGSAGAFAAQGRHLEDMRKLVFKEKE